MYFLLLFSLHFRSLSFFLKIKILRKNTVENENEWKVMMWENQTFENAFSLFHNIYFVDTLTFSL